MNMKMLIANNGGLDLAVFMGDPLLIPCFKFIVRESHLDPQTDRQTGERTDKWMKGIMDE